MEFAKRKKAEERYKIAVQNLQNIICGRLGNITFPKLEGIDGIENTAKVLQQAIESIVQARSEIKKKQESQKRIGGIVIGWFRASYPFANLLITIAKEGAAIICDETEKAKEIDDKLASLASIIERLRLNADFPHDIPNSYLNNLEWASLNVFTEVMDYLANAIRYFSKSLGLNIGKSIIGSESSTALKQSIVKLSEATQAYADAIADLSLVLIPSASVDFIADQNIIREKVQQDIDVEVFRWLSPSYLEVEEQLNASRNKRQNETLKWVLELPEFQQWRNADMNSIERFLWICGSAGIGKSIIAGFIINELKTLYPNSLVTYFFCKRGDIKLMYARNILLTIAYQCMKRSVAFCDALKGCKKEHPDPTSNIGISTLLERLLENPLRVSTDQLYIVLDGLDEVDRETLDLNDAYKRPEIEVLIEGLMKLSNARILFISRPEVNILRESELITKLVGEKENKSDIEIYVREKLLKLRLKFEKWYPKDAPEANEFFVESSHGLFLWVSTVIHQLSTTKTKSRFTMVFDSLWKSWGDMDKLYHGILSRIVDEDDQKWTIEILRWIITADTPLELNELMEIVQWSLNDEREDFSEFLNFECGSIIQVAELNGKRSVHLIHETFRSFLLDERQCPSKFFVNEPETHAYIATQCMQFLGRNNLPKHLNEYAATNWVRNLSKATSNGSYVQLVKELFELFKSDRVVKWVRFGISKIDDYNPIELDIKTEVDSLSLIMDWLEEMSGNMDGVQISESAVDTKLRQAREWHQNILVCKNLGEYIGKAATKLWLYETFDNSAQVGRVFCLGLKYYWMNGKEYWSEEKKVEKLCMTQFHDMEVWAGCGGTFKVNHGNIGVACAILRQWDKSIEAFEEDAKLKGDQFQLWTELGDAYITKGYHDCAIEMFQKALDRFPMKWQSWLELGTAFKAKGDYDRAIEIFQKALERFPMETWLWRALGNTFSAKGDHDHAIETFQKAIDRFPTESWMWRAFRNVFDANGDHNRAIETFQKAVDRFPTERRAWEALGDAFNAKGDHEGAIETFQKAVDRLPMDPWLWRALGHAFQAKGDHDRAIEKFQKAVDRFPTPWLWGALGNAFNAKGDYDRAIEIFQKALERFPMETWLWKALGDAFQAKGDYDHAIEIFQKAVDRFPKELLSWEEKVGHAFQAKGDHDRAIETFQKAVDRFPMEPWLWQALGDAFQAKGDQDHAIETFQKAVDRFPMESLLWEELRNAFQAKGDHDHAIETFQKAVERFPTERHAWKALGDAFNAKGDHDHAIETFRKAVDRFPGERRVWKALGDAFNAKGDRDHAIETFQKAVDRFPMESWLWQALGDAFQAKGDHDHAIETFQKAVDRFPMESCVWGALGDAFQAKGDHDHAIETFQNAVDRFPMELWLWERLGNGLTSNRNYDSAINAYEIGIEKDAVNKHVKTIDELVHSEIICNACELSGIRGYRYKCITCENYDLCKVCMGQSPNPHSEHDFLQIPSRQWALKRLKCNYHFEKPAVHVEILDNAQR